MQVYEVTFFDEETGGVDTMFVKASCVDAACDAVERMGEYEVIEATLVDRL